MTHRYPLGTIVFSRTQANLHGIVKKLWTAYDKTPIYTVRGSNGLEVNFSETHLEYLQVLPPP
jgi:hypothetical protein